MICGDSLTVEQLALPLKGGGAIPTSPLQFKVFMCHFDEIRHIFKENHYKGDHIGGNIEICLSLRYGGAIIGGAVFGKTRHDAKYAKGIILLELRRLACIEECPKNTESYFISKCVWWIKKYAKKVDALISYADKSVGHVGVIYRASNWEFIGESSPTPHVFWNGKRYHPRSLTIERPYSYKLREAIKTGSAKVEIGEPKNIYWYWINKSKMRGK